MARLDKNIGQAGNLSPKPQSNFIKHEKKEITGTTILIILVFCILLGVFGYFGVFTRYQEIGKLNKQLEELKAENEEVEKLVDQEEYDRINKEYMSYNREFIEKQDKYKNIGNRVDYLTRLEDLLLDKCTIKDIKIAKNTLSCKVEDISNRTLADICEFLNTDTTHGIESYQTSKIQGAAGSDSTGESLVTCELTIIFKPDLENGKTEQDSSTNNNTNSDNGGN